MKEALPVFEVTDLHVRYGAMEAVKGVSFTLARGETLGIRWCFRTPSAPSIRA